MLGKDTGHSVSLQVVRFYLHQVKAEAEATALVADSSYQNSSWFPLHECHCPLAEHEEMALCHPEET